MNEPDKDAMKPAGLDERTKVRRVLIAQYLLHEIQHHTLGQAGQHGEAPLIPKAHSPIDIYKCLHQGEFGVGHDIEHPERFKLRLYQETMQCEPGDPALEPALEDISADGRVLRVNLRAVRGIFDDDPKKRSDQLAQICFESAGTTRGSAERFLEALSFFADLNQAGELRLAERTFAFPAEMIGRFLFEIQDVIRRIHQIPVFSHSSAYRQLNRPAYRVVDRSVLEKSPLAMLLENSAVARSGIETNL